MENPHIRKAVPGDLQDIMGLVAPSVGKMQACGVSEMRRDTRLNQKNFELSPEFMYLCENYSGMFWF